MRPKASPHGLKLSTAGKRCLTAILEAELIGAPLEAYVWRAKNPKKIPHIEELTRNRMIESQDQSHYVVTLFGLMRAPGERAKSELSRCERLFRALRRHYSVDPKSPILIRDLVERTKTSPGEILQSARFLSRSPAYLSIQLDQEYPRLFPNEQYVTLNGFEELKEKSLEQARSTAGVLLPEIRAIGELASLSTQSSVSLENKSVKGNCPCCGPDRRAEVVATYVATWAERSVSGRETYNVLKCGGCGEIYFQHLSECSEDMDYEYDENGETVGIPKPRITYWPPPILRRSPPWVDRLEDETLRDVLREVYGALDANHRTLAAIGARTVLDRAMVLLEAPEESSFAGKLADLVRCQIISDHEKDILAVLTDAGSASAHRGWCPTAQNLSTIMDGTENFLHRTFIVGKAASAMKAHVPPRPKRSKPAKESN
jgi:hypothetical protein